MRFRGTSLWAGIISGGIAQYQTTQALQKGLMSKNDYAVQTTKNVTGAAGLIAGIEYGAILGTRIMPGIGTIAGSIIGGIFGDRIGSMVGIQAGSTLFQNRMLSLESTSQPMVSPGLSEYHRDMEDNAKILQ